MVLIHRLYEIYCMLNLLVPALRIYIYKVETRKT